MAFSGHLVERGTSELRVVSTADYVEACLPTAGAVRLCRRLRLLDGPSGVEQLA